ncbi:MAG: hypothetical protein K2K98_11820 [Muribaculaceae bacterium]|nr:hypothetical protein [Muribaculaceae bacterium]
MKENGIGILTEPRFWGILTDLYPFAHESKLKDSYKACISKGWVAGIVSLSGDKDSIFEYISRLVEAYQGSYRKELMTCLFSVAIAIGKCTEMDYAVFINRTASSLNPTHIGNSDALDKSKVRFVSNQNSYMQQLSTSYQSPNSKLYNQNGKQSKGNQSMIFWLTGLVMVCVIAIPLAIITFNKYASSKSQTEWQSDSEYEKKVSENYERVKNRENYDSELSVKNIGLGSDYNTAVRYMKSNENFKDFDERYYELDNSGRLHPVFQLMNDRIRISTKKTAGGSTKDEIIRGRVFITNTVLDTIPIKLKVFESDGKVPFMIIEGTEGIFSYYKYFGALLELYHEKYGMAEVRTYDGMPYNPENFYYPNNFMDERHEDDVWTFSTGMIRLGLNRILYASTDFLDSINSQYDRTKIEYEKKEILKQRLQEQKLLQTLREDSIRRVKNHENAIKDI